MKASRGEIEVMATERFTRVHGTNIAHALGPASPLIAIDIDITDSSESRRACIAAWNILGPTPLVRIGRAPKVALFYRKGTERFNDVRGRSVEVFANSGSMIWFGVHPETKSEYRWPRYSPLEVTPEEVPRLSPDRLRKFLGSCPALGKLSNGRGVSNDIFVRLREERRTANSEVEFLEVIKRQLAEMKSSRNGEGDRSFTIASVTYSLVRNGFSDKEIEVILAATFERWPRESRSLRRRVSMTVSSARKKCGERSKPWQQSRQIS